ncbi:Metallo-peptidase family M12-domain-containing protein [Powellomyces hirtus]|nr:Metallo-peptidase family M12-domain-containing protein [Powellomyces hirtus]
MSHSFRLIAVLFLSCLLIIQSISAHSTAFPPVRSYDFVDKIQITKRKLSTVNLSFRAVNQTFNLELVQNSDLLHPQAVVKHDSESSEMDQYVDLHRIAAKMYKGDVMETDEAGSPRRVGWARMYYDADQNMFEGTFTASDIMYHVKDIDVYHKTRRSIDIPVLPSSSRSERHRASRMILLMDRDQSGAINEMSDPSMLVKRAEPDGHAQCGFDTTFNKLASRAYADKVERDAATLTKRAPAGCPSSRRVLFMAAAADCTYVKLHGGKEASLTQILQNWNAASRVYEESFNIALGLIQVFLQDVCTPTDDLLKWNRECADSYSINQRLSDFSEWRGKKTPDEAGLWHLMTNCPSGPSVGVAWLKTLCNVETITQQSDSGVQFVSGTGVSAAVNVEWKVVAHEIGHNFGAVHDCSGLTGQCPCTDPEVCQCCPCAGTCDCNGKFIMHPTDSSSTDAFSPCSVNAICGAFPKFGTCLKEPGSLTLISSGICGNGIREGDEQCDCGTAAECANDPCCSAGCKLKASAKCSDKNDECCAQCQLKTNGTVCRSSTGVCDVPETCNGVNATCPIDVFQPDKTSCSSGAITGQCASGQCTSRDLQCQNQSLLSLTGACKDQESECKLFCESSRGCVSLDSYFVDGTPCGFSGSGICKRGSCEAGNIVDQALGWINSHRAIAIPILILAGLLLLSFIYSIIRCICCRPRAAKVIASRGAPIHQQQQTWVDPAVYNGPTYPAPTRTAPSYPAPSRTPSHSGSRTVPSYPR